MDDITRLNVLRLTMSSNKLQENICKLEKQQETIKTALDGYKKIVVDNNKNN